MIKSDEAGEAHAHALLKWMDSIGKVGHACEAEIANIPIDQRE